MTAVEENSASLLIVSEKQINVNSNIPEDKKTAPLDEYHNNSTHKKERQEHLSIGQGTRNILNDIRGLTFLIEDKPEMLSELSKQLSVIREGLYSQLPKEKGVLLQKTSLKQVKRKNVNTKLDSLQLRKRKRKR